MSAIIVVVAALFGATLTAQVAPPPAECSTNCNNLPKAEGYKPLSMAVAPKE